MSAFLALLVGIGLGAALERWRDRRRWRKAFLRIHQRGQITVIPPTTAELHLPPWIDVTGIDQTPRSEWTCGPECPKEA